MPLYYQPDLSRFLLLLCLFLGIFSCRKENLDPWDNLSSAYQSAYLIEQLTPPATGTIYFIDAQNGDKDHEGTSEAEAFKEVKQLENIVFEPGDQILFKRGQIHLGVMQIEQSGTEDHPIYIAAYGSGSLPILRTDKGKNSQPLSIWKADHITIQNLNIQGGNFAVLLDGSNFITIEGCRIGQGSESGLRATGRHSETGGSNHGIVRHCLIYSGLSGNTGDLQGTDGIQLMDGASNWHIYQNELKAWAHSALSVKPIYTALNSNNNLIENNLFDCGDIDYMRAFDITGPENRASNNLFQKNIIRQQTVTSHLHGNGNTIAYNLFLGLKASSATEQPWAIDFHVFIGNSGGVDRKDYVCFDNHIYNNLFLDYDQGVGVRILNSKNGTSHFVHDNKIVNNIFFNTGTPIEQDEEPTNITITNNLFFTPSQTSQFSFDNSLYNLEDFQSLTGTNGFKIRDNLEEDPLFSNSVMEDFLLKMGSPAIENGLDVGLTEDFRGNPISGFPEIGPHEY